MSYFSQATFAFLRDLARNNQRAWFHANKARYETEVRDPFLRLIADLAEPLSRISPNFRADARAVGGSMFRIQRDTRFATDKSPYKTWAGARFLHVRGRERQAPLFYLQIEPDNCFVAAGIWRPAPEAQRRIRAFLLDNPAAWKRAVHAPAFRRRFDLVGESLVRPPRGFDPEHELIDDLRRKDFVARSALDSQAVLGARLLETVAEDFARMAPMVDYLCAAIDLEF